MVFSYKIVLIFICRNLCGSRIRVEHSTGKVRPKPWLRGGRGPPPSSSSSSSSRNSRRPFDPADRCYECGGRGHYAYDCSRYRGGKDRERKDSRSKRSRYGFYFPNMNSSMFLQYKVVLTYWNTIIWFYCLKWDVEIILLFNIIVFRNLWISVCVWKI